jgi:hypothetical protein
VISVVCEKNENLKIFLGVFLVISMIAVCSDFAGDAGDFIYLRKKRKSGKFWLCVAWT